MNRTVILVVAKSPRAGHAKTRLSPPASARCAASIAAASLLDTLSAVCSVPDARPLIAWTGSLEHAERRDELASVMSEIRTVPQRGEDFAHRLANAHADVATMWPGMPVLQIGMDTPQVDAELLASSARRLHEDGSPDAVLGPAADGGWWALGLRDPREAAVLRSVPMSRPDTGRLTGRALGDAGLRVAQLPELADVDTMQDAEQVAELIPESEFAAAVRSATIAENIERAG